MSTVGKANQTDPIVLEEESTTSQCTITHTKENIHNAMWYACKVITYGVLDNNV